MAKTAYISDGPSLDEAVKVSGNGPGQVSSSQTASPLGAGTGSSASGQSQVRRSNDWKYACCKYANSRNK